MFSENSQQQTYKPGSVPSLHKGGSGACHLSTACVATSLYRSTLRLRRTAFCLCAPVYMNFQLPGCTAPMSPPAWWALAPPSHPYHPCGWRLFSSTCPDPCGPLLIRKRDVLRCPDFPLAYKYRPATSRSAADGAQRYTLLPTRFSNPVGRTKMAVERSIC